MVSSKVPRSAHSSSSRRNSGGGARNAQLVETLAQRLRETVTIDEVTALLDEAARALGFRHYALVQHADLARPPRRLVFLQNYPAPWVEAFAQLGLHRHDPVQRLAGSRPGSFAWRDLPGLLTLTAPARRVLEAARQAGLGEGFTVPLHVPGQRSASCSFAALPGRALPENGLLAAELLAHLAFAAVFDILLAPGGQAPPRLSRREEECVALVAHGKTDWEIAAILGLSEETVTQYLKSARARFGVARRSQLAIAALYHGRIGLDELVSWQ